MPAAEWPLFLPIGMEVWGHFKTLSNTLKNHCWSFDSNCSPIFGAEAKTRKCCVSRMPEVNIHVLPGLSGSQWFTLQFTSSMSVCYKGILIVRALPWFTLPVFFLASCEYELLRCVRRPFPFLEEQHWKQEIKTFLAVFVLWNSEKYPLKAYKLSTLKRAAKAG